jgi:REP element-mobilizing transposase RayT
MDTRTGWPFHRRSIRLNGYDYSSPGAYYVTICTADRQHLLGTIETGAMHLNENGQIVDDGWRWLVTHFDAVTLDAWVVLPNHLHGIIVLTPNPARRKPLGQIVGAFKTVTTKRINAIRQTPGAPVWQRDFWDHVIRDEFEMNTIRTYIANNTQNWSADEFNRPTGRGAS